MYDTDVTLTAHVLMLGTTLPGLGITPTGPVRFQASLDEGASWYTVGTGYLHGCLLRQCTVTVTTDELEDGFNLVRAVYSGDKIFRGSASGTTYVQVDLPPEPPPTASTSSSCAPTQPCTTAPITADNGSTTLTVHTNPSTQSNTVTASLTEGEILHCPGDDDANPGTALATFTSTASDVNKTVTYRVDDDAAAQTIHDNYVANGTLFLGCYASPNPFSGYTNGVFQPATQVMEPSGDLYEAQLSSCVNNSHPQPCFSLLDGTGLSDKYVEVTIETPTGDPKFTPN